MNPVLSKSGWRRLAALISDRSWIKAAAPLPPWGAAFGLPTQRTSGVPGRDLNFRLSTGDSHTLGFSFSCGSCQGGRLEIGGGARYGYADRTKDCRHA
jgi:hypothetical protein